MKFLNVMNFNILFNILYTQIKIDYFKYLLGLDKNHLRTYEYSN